MAAALLLTAGALFILYAGRHLGFFYDDWSILLTRHDGGISSLIDAQNGHPVFLLVATYRAIFELFGVDSYTPFRVVLTVLHVTACGALYILARRRVGPWAALAPTALMLFLGAGYHNILWAIQISYVGSIATGLIALALLDPRPAVDRSSEPRAGGRGTTADVLVCLLLLVSVAWSSIGIAFLAAVAVELAVDRRTRRRLWVAAVPVVLYGLWYLIYSGDGQGEARAENILKIPQYIVDSAAGASAGIAGMSLTWGPPLLLFAIGGVWFARHARGAAAPPLSPRLAGLTAGVLVQWTITALTRAQLAEPAASRYVYVGAVFLLAIAVELLWPPRRDLRVAAAIAVLTSAAVVSSIGLMRDGQRDLRAMWESVRASLSALEIAGPAAPPTLQPEPQRAPQVTAGPYLKTVAAIGSPAWRPEQLAAQPDRMREQADRVLEQAVAPIVTEVDGPLRADGSLVVDGVPAGYARPSKDACTTVLPAGEVGGAIELSVAVGTAITVSSAGGGPVDVRLRRFADGFSGNPVATVQQRAATRIALQMDQDPERVWHVRLTSPQRFMVCAG